MGEASRNKGAEMKLVEHQAAFLLDVSKLIQYISSRGYKVTGGELYRSPEQQEIYVKTDRSKTMNSLHLSRLAIDFNFFKGEKPVLDKKELEPFGLYWESLHPLNSWGGNGIRLVDVPHFSRGIVKPEWRRSLTN